MRTREKAVGVLLSVLMIFTAATAVTAGEIPDELTVSGSGTTTLSTLLPVSVTCGADSDTAEARLFGVAKLKKIGIRRERPGKVMLAGTLFGLKLYSDGVMVVGLSDFESKGVRVNPAREAGISQGDVIISAGGKEIRTNADFAETIRQSRGTVTLELKTDGGEPKKVSLTPAYSDADDCLKTGMWVRDSAAGIGTLTYIDPASGGFGGLGHGICDCDTHAIVPLSEGEIVAAQMTDIRRGVRGSAGEIRGILSEDSLGVLESNTSRGTFGRYTADIPRLKEYDTALRQEVKPGKASILCAVEQDGVPRLYDVTIDKINYTGAPSRNMIITVTDKNLLRITGGIIQGMSGSPIIQNGKFAGAVTHVFVNNPACGYAIFAENMRGQQETQE